MLNIIILSNDFLAVFEVFFDLYSLIFWQNCVILGAQPCKSTTGN